MTEARQDGYHYSPYFEIAEGRSPIVISAPHGGRENPNALEKYDNKDSRKPDVNTDLLAREIADSVREAGYEASMVINLLQRKLLELNWWRSSVEGMPELEKLFDLYYRTLHDYAAAAVNEYGFAVVIDVHGYDDGKRGDFVHGFPPGALCFGTRCGNLIPRRLIGAFEAFRAALIDAGYDVFPARGFSEYGLFVGGSIVESFKGMNDVAAVQIETPLSVRIDDERRKKLAVAIGGALMEFIREAGNA